MDLNGPHYRSHE